MGEWFRSKAAGIELRVPEGATEVRRAGVPDLISEFVQDKQGLLLRVSKMEFTTPRTLQDTKSLDGAKVPGIMNDLVSSLKREHPTAEVLRNEIVQMRGREVGLLAYRFSLGTTRRMLQQAIFPYADNYYYQVMMTATTGKGPAGAGVDPKEKAVADLFSDIVDTVHIIDRTEIAKDQEARLKRSTDLMEDLRGPNLMAKAIVPEQWLRLTRDGKDIGYTYVTEERTKLNGRDGVLVSVRSRTVAGQDNHVEVTSRMFVADFWRNETWTHMVETQAGKKSDTTSELGLSTLEQKYKLDKPNELGEAAAPEDPKQPPVKRVTKHRLEVRAQAGKVGGKPIEWEQLPEVYLPQVIKHLLPRMLPLDKPQTYLFVTYVSETRQLMMRYVDVGQPKDISFNGQRVRAVPVSDRVGLEGVPTTYYVSPEGKYLGSEAIYQTGNGTSTIRVLPSDRQTLEKIWQNAKLTKPEASDMPVMPDVLR